MAVDFDVCVEIDRTGKDKLYYIYKLKNGMKFWLTKNKTLDRWDGAKAYVKTWEQATKLVDKIFAGEICE